VEAAHNVMGCKRLYGCRKDSINKKTCVTDIISVLRNKYVICLQIRNLLLEILHLEK